MRPLVATVASIAASALLVGCPSTAPRDAGEDTRAHAPEVVDADDRDATIPTDAELDVASRRDVQRPGPYPLAEELPERSELPSLFESFDRSRTASTRGDWEGWRRDELKDLFRYYVYGYEPAAMAVSARSTQTIADIAPSVGEYLEFELSFVGIDTRIHVSLYRPRGIARPPVFVALNKCGNQEVIADPRVRATTAWIDAPNCGGTPEAGRGVRSSHWPVSTIASRGYAFATFHESDLDPDDPADTTFSDGVHREALDPRRDPRVRWGRIAAWAWGISRVVDWLQTSNLVDPQQIAVVGHSRRGKASLLAGALDQRIAMVFAHQSGTAGSALARSPVGESIAAINLFFPSWFDAVFKGFDRRELRLPIDQHQLIALVAPRVALFTDGDADEWADPPGSRAAVEAARPAWELYEDAGVSDGGAEAGVRSRLAWQSRPGAHSLGAEDWALFLAFADQHVRR
ncbi:MAG: hypothetical protein JNK05_01010 [Myxococcales bacterium]|nr:hypothetical protein [Myxococcales bacterium]